MINNRRKIVCGNKTRETVIPFDLALSINNKQFTQLHYLVHYCTHVCCCQHLWPPPLRACPHFIFVYSSRNRNRFLKVLIHGLVLLEQVHMTNQSIVVSDGWLNCLMAYWNCRFLTVSGVQLAQSNQVHCRSVVFFSHLKSKVGNILANDCIQYWWHTYIVKNTQITHSSLTLSNLSSFNIVSIFRCPRPPFNPVYARRLDPSVLAFSLSSQRHPYICILFSSRVISSHHVMFFFRNVAFYSQVKSKVDNIQGFITVY